MLYMVFTNLINSYDMVKASNLVNTGNFFPIGYSYIEIILDRNGGAITSVEIEW